jgi:DNA-binding transcriptional ArsR family regulator
MDNINAFDPLEAFSNSTRRQLMERLRAGPCSVNELTRAVPVSQPAVSQHLAVLKQARLVRAERRGQQRIYHLDRTGLRALREYVESFWDTALRAFEAAAEQEAEAKDDDKENPND